MNIHFSIFLDVTASIEGEGNEKEIKMRKEIGPLFVKGS
jgi:hypothetical protein